MANGELGNLIFISYRRADSAAHTLALRLELETRLTAAQVFVDTRTVQGGDEWARQIEDALRVATVILPVIGKQWAGSDSASGARRIDDPADWVHKEISGALASKRGRIIPLLVDDTSPLRRADLPAGLQDLADIQPLSLDLRRWDQDIQAVINLLHSKFAFESKRKDFKYPKTRSDGGQDDGGALGGAGEGGRGRITRVAS